MPGKPGTRIWRWRALTLFGVNALIVIHVLHWWLTGDSLARFVLDDAAHTLERGVVNPGFVLFALALLVTLLFGRFFCGWACHMAALQDACSWLLRRIGIRPRQFNARLIGYAPLVLALYLFVWPLFKRELLLPLIRPSWPALADWLGPVAPFEGWSASWRTSELWSGLPSIWVAIPFLLLSGFAMVYFLGTRGLCRYGCPYGGLFQQTARFSPVAITVDSDRCDDCALCTAACTAGVRVHDEISTYGIVVNRDCMRTLDCVDVCPHDALALKPGRPPAARGPSDGIRHYDLAAGEEGLAALVMLVTAVGTRGMYGQIPLLLAVTLGAIGAFLAVLGYRLAHRPGLRFAGRTLKASGQQTGAGMAWSLVITAAMLLLAHSLTVRLALERAEMLDRRITVPMEIVLSGSAEFLPGAVRRDAQDALFWYRQADAWNHGGLGLARWPHIPLRRAWLHLVRGEYDQADRLLQRARTARPGDPALIAAMADSRRARTAQQQMAH